MSRTQQAAPPRTLADQLRGWPDERLARLLADRPDLATPAPHDSAQLASRAATRSSVIRALDGLTRLELSVLDALVVAGQTTSDRLISMVHADPAATGDAVVRLVDLALAWESPGGLRPLSGVADALRGDESAGISGLRPMSPDPADPGTVADRIAALSPAARALLAHVDDHGGEGTTGSARRTVSPADAATPVEELVAHRLLLPRDGGTLVLPGEVGLVLRGGRTTRTPRDEVPEVATTDRDVALVERTAAGAAFEAVRRVELVLDHWGLEPPGVLRGGGLSVRDLKATARDLQVDEPEAGLLVELAAVAGLLTEGADEDGDAVWLPTDAFDAWSAGSVAERWATLALAWLDTTRVPSLVGTRDPAGRAWNALAPDLSSHLAPEARRLALEELAALPAGAALAAGTGVPSLVSRVAWRRPRRPSVHGDLVAAAVVEAAALGLTGAGALSDAGRAVISGDHDAAVAAVVPHLPQPVDHVLLQADLTAVAPGPLETELARTLHLVAGVESRGGATVYRFTPGSVRRAFDAGWTALEVHEFVGSVSRTPVPQPLTYLVDDVSRTFGTVRVGQAESFLRADDESALTELLHHPRAGSLGLRRIAPTVLVSTVPVDLLLPRLRDLGAAPVVEAPDGTVRVARRDLLRARRPRATRSHGAVLARQQASVAAVVTAVRSGDRAHASRPDIASATTTPTGALTALREAIEAGSTVVIGYVDNHGARSDRVVDPLRLEGGTLTARDHRADDERAFAVHRITSVAALPARP
jgi:Helicase conserved C-terminal domain